MKKKLNDPNDSAAAKYAESKDVSIHDFHVPTWTPTPSAGATGLSDWHFTALF